MFSSLNISQKLYGTTGIIAFFLVVLTIIAYQSMIEVESLNNSSALLQKSRSDMLMLRRNEKDFLMRNLIKYQDKFDKNFTVLKATVSALQSQLSGDGIELTNEFRTLNTQFNAYQKNFHQVIAVTSDIGLTHEVGLRGSLRKSVHSAEEAIKQEKDNQLLADMLMLRRNEKDFMMRLLPKYIDKHSANFDKLISNLSSSNLEVSHKEQISLYMDAYQADFLKLAEGLKTKGLTPDSGIRGKMRSTVHKTEEILKNLDKEINQLIEVESTKNIIFLGVVALVIISVISISLIFLARNITLRLLIINKKMAGISQGKADLTAEIKLKGQDEITDIANNYNQTIDKIKELVVSISGVSIELTKNSEFLREAATQTTDFASEQCSDSEQVVGSVEDMISSGDLISGHITSATEAATDATKETLTGEKVVTQAETTIRNLAQSLSSSTEQVTELEKDSDGIGKVLDVIRSIAEQTNLLALNAAIEAARAGESGRGFAVVADEVRTLAQRTQEATSEINDLIERLQKGVKNTVHTIQSGTKEAESGAENANCAKNSFERITNSVKNIFDLSGQISSVSQSQLSINQTVRDGVSKISHRSQKTLENTEITRDFSVGLTQQAKVLNSLVGQYKV